MSDYRCRPISADNFTAADVLAALPDTGIPLDIVDPQPENERRAHFAALAVHRYAEATGTATGESVFLVLSDLMGDLRHLLDALRDVESDGYPTTLPELADNGAGHYRAEVQGVL